MNHPSIDWLTVGVAFGIAIILFSILIISVKRKRY